MAASAGGRVWRQLWRRPPAVAGAVVVLFFVVLALGAPWIATSDPQRSDYGKIRKAPTAANPFGTDDLGRDTFSRVVWGTRVSMQDSIRGEIQPTERRCPPPGTTCASWPAGGSSRRSRSGSRRSAIFR